MSANANTAAPTGRNKPAQGKHPATAGDAALGHASQNTSSPEGAKQGGELPNGWTHTTLGQLSGERGQSVEPARTPEKQFELYSVPSFPDKMPEVVSGKEVGSNKQLVQPRSVLLCKINPRINRAWVVGDFTSHTKIASTEWIVFPATEDVVPDFLCYFLQKNAVRDFLAHNASGVGGSLMRVKPSTLRDFPFGYPSETEQRRIVAEIEKQFTRLEAGVAALRRVQANLKRYRAAVLKAACEGRLVPTEAELQKSEGRGQKSKAKFETGAELLARILTERRQNWQGRGQYKEPAAPNTANLPLLPDGWTWASVEQLAAFVQYGSSAKTNEDSSGVPVLRMGNIQEGKFDFEKLKYLPEAHDEFPDLLLAKGDLLFNRTNSAELVGKTAVFRGTPEPCSFASYLIRVRLCGGCLPDLVSYFINSVFGRAWIAGCVSQQVGQANVNGTKLQALAIPLPPLAEQTRIVAEVERRLSVVEELESVVTANLQRATRLRQSILQKAFTGELLDPH